MVTAMDSWPERRPDRKSSTSVAESTVPVPTCVLLENTGVALISE